jgi:hypothetical protein
MHTQRTAAQLLCLLLCGCATGPVVTGDSRGFFDTSKGMYGGNEYEARSPEGKITLAGASASAPAAPQAAAAAPAQMAAAAPAPAPVPAALAAPAETTIRIDANAYAAIFGTSAAPIRPSAEQLMRLDSLAIVTAESARIDLQKKILACRRAGDACRIAHD